MPEDTAVAPKKGGAFKVVALTALIGFGLGLGAGLYAKGSLGANAVEESANNDAQDHHAHGDGGASSRVEVGRITLTMVADPGAEARHILVNPVLVLASDLEGHEPIDEEEISVQIRDSFIEYLSQLSPRDVAGSAGMSILRAELLRRAQALLPDQQIEQILFRDFVIQ